MPRRRTPPGWPMPCAKSRVHPRARTGCGTASSPRTPGRACGRGRARARRTAVSTSATPGAGCWFPASGPARPSPITAPTARPGSPGCSGFRQPTRPGTPGSRSGPATRTTCPTGNGSCMSSPTASDGKPRLQRRDDRPKAAVTIFRQLGRRHDDREPESRSDPRCGCCISAPWSTAKKAAKQGDDLGRTAGLAPDGRCDHRGAGARA